MNQSEYKKIISDAIQAEVEAFTYYNAVAAKAKDAVIKSLFEELAEEETKHKVTLEGFLAKGPEKMHFVESKDYKVGDSLPTPALTADLKPVDGIVIAIKKELEAMQMYTQLAQASGEEAQKKLFLELASMERGHKSRLEDLYTNMAFPEAW
ncbi:MAG: ferritin family protein [Deltaproteobacteria bacterium]|nr:ferritin family protein [Deltaproteobacteria bacterium]